MRKRTRPMIDSFSYPSDKEEVMNNFEKIAFREGRSKSSLLFSLIEKHVLIHGEGNPSFAIDKWVDQSDLLALPTIGELLDQDRLAELDLEELMVLAKQIRARAQEVNHQLRKRLIPRYDFDMRVGL